MKTGILFTALCLGVLTAAAQPANPTPAIEPAPGVAWSLDDCIAYAQRNNTGVQQRALRVEQGDLTLSTSQLSRLPDLSASVGYNVSFNRSIGSTNVAQNGTMQNASLNLSTSIPVFEGFAINRRIKGDKLDLSAAVQDLERAREDVAVQVMTLYLQVLYTKELVIVAERQLTLSTQQSQRSRTRFEAGKMPESAVYESEALRASDELRLTQARNDMQLALLDLSQALNRPSAMDFDIQEPPMESLLQQAMLTQMTPAEQVYGFAVENRPHIRAEKLRLESSENAIRTARSALFPRLSLGAGYGTGVYSNDSDDFWPQFRKNGSQHVGLTMSIPIFNRQATRNKVRSAQISLRNQRTVLTEAEQSLRKQIEQAWYNATAAAAKYNSATVASASAQKAFSYELEKSEAGRSTIFDFNDAKTRLQKADSDLAQAKYELVFRRKILDYYRGEPLKL